MVCLDCKSPSAAIHRCQTMQQLCCGQGHAQHFSPAIVYVSKAHEGLLWQSINVQPNLALHMPHQSTHQASVITTAGQWVVMQHTGVMKHASNKEGQHTPPGTCNYAAAQLLHQGNTAYNPTTEAPAQSLCVHQSTTYLAGSPPSICWSQGPPSGDRSAGRAALRSATNFN